nr:PREDICTED: squalene monooxygenase-like [Latimeria chalumnae]|eukprot:XP_005998767.1 PREDICTED: squalene monooxygenase-like [Latimeria chalumnae]
MFSNTVNSLANWFQKLLTRTLRYTERLNKYFQPDHIYSSNTVKIIEGTVTNLLEEGDRVVGVEYKDKATGETKELFSALTVVADGMFSNFRKTLTSGKYRVQSHYVGFVIKDCPAFRKDKVEYILANQNMAIAYQISSNETRFFVDIQGEMPRNMKQYLIETVYPQLPERIKEAFLKTIQTDPLKTWPVGHMGPTPVLKPGVLILGDAYNVRNPTTGSGMSIALNDLSIWRDFLKNIPDLYDDKAILQAKKKFHKMRKGNHSFVVTVLAQFIYDIFTATGGSVLKLRKAYFNYFQVGNCGPEPVEMLSILYPEPKKLTGHFLAAAFHAIHYSFKVEPWYLLPRAFFNSGAVLLSGMSLLFPIMYTEMQ